MEIERDMPSLSTWWGKTLGILSRAQDEIVKVSQLGKTQIDRSFLTHERNKLFNKLGKLYYRLIKEDKIRMPDLNRVVDQIDRLSERIEAMEARVKGLTHDLSLKLDAEQETDLIRQKVKSHRFRIRRKKH